MIRYNNVDFLEVGGLHLAWNHLKRHYRNISKYNCKYHDAYIDIEIGELSEEKTHEGDIDTIPSFINIKITYGGRDIVNQRYTREDLLDLMKLEDCPYLCYLFGKKEDIYREMMLSVHQSMENRAMYIHHTKMANYYKNLI